MVNLKLNGELGNLNVSSSEYRLDPKKEYVIDFADEISTQSSIMATVQAMGLPAISDFHDWLLANGFSADMPNPTNDFVSKFYGKQPLWETELSQGIVVKAEDDSDYYIVLECSRENTGFKHTQIILTMGGCM